MSTHYITDFEEITALREASMASMSLGIGLTLIRKYDFQETGYFYSGLYSIATGIERLMKIILIYDDRLNNHNDRSNIKHFGHDLNKLLEKAIEINRKHDFRIRDDFFQSDDLYLKIISILTGYGETTRYLNLDYLARSKASSVESSERWVEPLERWNKEIWQAIIDRHYRAHRDESSGEINYFRRNGFLSPDQAIKQKYSVYYIYVIVRFLSNLLEKLEDTGNFFPYLSEYFTIFRITDKSYILRKKSWNPIRPYHF